MREGGRGEERRGEERRGEERRERNLLLDFVFASLYLGENVFIGVRSDGGRKNGRIKGGEVGERWVLFIGGGK